MPTEKTDIVKELRLRSWARQNYVAPADRSTDWHPIVLDEMNRRDVEAAAMQEDIAAWQQTKTSPSSIVPLIPGSLLKLHPPHKEVPAPKFMSQVQSAAIREELARSGWY
ncbi:hypothetical protein Pla110_21220 [Polystyrenella longa]|uniref:Uncharacterized protein n=1 Tax=Polystyrenella longa TaxID=2528007 RepID=A0A518CMG7_9PLAN|nr:hypothetical protein [Polystyrenella longa]QDU80393.1 hypothetical protein Pla110_21220 [Polystyrenella longa]